MGGMKYLILDNIRSNYNVGAIFRTADAAGVAKIFLVGYTPAPIDRFGREVKELLKTSLGATKTVPWESVPDCLGLVKRLQTDGVTVVAVELTPTSISLYDFTVPENVAYIMGNEIDGVSPDVLAAVDVVVEIPMHGMKESLNVSVATGIMLYAR
jgi:23S rRNA (guanosine2251-2'-O)-methyltransferase